MAKAQRIYAEYVIRNIDKAKRELQKLEDGLAWPSRSDEKGGGGISDPTYQTAMIFTRDERRHHLKSIIETVESVYQAQPPERKLAIELMYWERPKRLCGEGVALEIGCSRKTLYRWLDEILYEVAERTGVV